MATGEGRRKRVEDGTLVSDDEAKIDIFDIFEISMLFVSI